MSSAKKIAANRRNAQRSTGPKTSAGKAVARLNAVSHGLRAAAPVVPGEDTDQWEAFRVAVVSDLAPAGILEAELAERVALLSWRLRRVVGYEAGVIARTVEAATRGIRGEEVDDADEDRLGGFMTRTDDEPTVTSVREKMERAGGCVRNAERLARLYAELSVAADDARFEGVDALDLLDGLTDYLPEDDPPTDDEDLDDELPPLDPMTDPHHPRFLLAVGVSQDQHDEPESWDGWTTRVIRLGVERVARTVKWTGAKLLARAVRDSATDLDDERRELGELRRQLKEVTKAAAVQERNARRIALVPAAEVTETVMKYEAHLQRQLVQVLHELERMRATRSADPPPPPVAVDVNVHAPPGALPQFGDRE